MCNVDEKSVVSGNEYVSRVRTVAEQEGGLVYWFGAAIEANIAELEDGGAGDVLSDLGLDEPGVAEIDSLSPIPFSNCRPILRQAKRGSGMDHPKRIHRPEAAGVIHTDFQKGFIRAEVVQYADFVQYGSELAVKEAGKLSVEGKDYLVQDGDIMHFRFNV